MDGGVFGVAFAFDGVATFGLDGDFAIGFLFNQFTGWLGATVVPGDWRLISLGDLTRKD